MRTGLITVLGLCHKRGNQSDSRLSWFMFHNIYYMYIGIENKEKRNSTILLTNMSEHEETNKFNKELEDSREIMITINLYCRKCHPFWSQWYPNKSDSVMELWWSWVWSQGNMAQGHIYLQFLSRWTNVQSSNCRTSTIMVHVTYLYLSWLEILHDTHNCAPSQGVLPISPL